MIRKRHTSTIQLLLLLCLAAFALSGCASKSAVNGNTPALRTAPLLTDPLTGDIAPVHDPSLFLQDGTYFVFTSDPGHPRNQHFLPIRCSPDGVNWRRCGQVFTSIPAWVQRAVPGIANLWAPDISFFDGLYHVYYAGSTLGSQQSVIGLATNTTLDPTDPKYHWEDRGEVLASHPGADFNAIDPNILVDREGRVWLQFGSYWGGIKQREIDPHTGMLLPSNRTRYNLARRPFVQDDPIEGASLVEHGGFFYLFLSIDRCCEPRLAQDNYKQVVGRSLSPHGPFVDRRGVSLMHGGGSLLLEGNSQWLAPGGGTVYQDPHSRDGILVFHALNIANRGLPSLWLKHIQWETGWPVLD